MNEQHTPAPWNCAPQGDGWHITAHTPMKGGETLFTRVATAHGMKGNDARLIAASPDLLALVHQYASECGDCSGTRITPDGKGGDEPCTECAFIWTVIEKAEGRS